MYNLKLKYVRLERYNEIIIFPELLQHSDFMKFEPVSAGFCHIQGETVVCYGESISLRLKSDPEDTYIATGQVFGYEAEQTKRKEDEK